MTQLSKTIAGLFVQNCIWGIKKKNYRTLDYAQYQLLHFKLKTEI